MTLATLFRSRLLATLKFRSPYQLRQTSATAHTQEIVLQQIPRRAPALNLHAQARAEKLL